VVSVPQKLRAALSHWRCDVTRQIELDLRELAAAVSGSALDLGCGAKPYKRLFARATSYVGIDLPPERSTNKLEKRADVYADLTALPLADSSFDVVLCTQVLEHLLEPSAALAEVRRVLRNHGLAIFTVPFLAAEHEAPHDYFRFTPYAMADLLARNGFVQVRVKKQFGFWSAIGEMIFWHYHRKVEGTSWQKYWYAAGTTLMLRFFHLLNQLDPDDHLVLNLCVTARKWDRSATAGLSVSEAGAALAAAPH
jgi:ubiquinone/menaquinone biosynthesis C-methylase UbiE